MSCCAAAGYSESGFGLAAGQLCLALVAPLLVALAVAVATGRMHVACAAVGVRALSRLLGRRAGSRPASCRLPCRSEGRAFVCCAGGRCQDLHIRLRIDRAVGSGVVVGRLAVDGFQDQLVVLVRQLVAELSDVVACSGDVVDESSERRLLCAIGAECQLLHDLLEPVGQGLLHLSVALVWLPRLEVTCEQLLE